MTLSSGSRLALPFGVSILLILLSRFPLLPTHLYSFDSVNLALALEDFDPARNQPQPPGYPLFVAEARLLYRLLPTPEGTFSALKILISTLSVAFLFLLGKRMFCTWVGVVAAALLFVNPPFWYAGLTSPLRLHLAFLSVLVAYFCWRAVAGEPKYFYIASIALGLGSGFRPGLLLFLLPLWGLAAWECRQKARIYRGLPLLVASTLIWVGILAYAYGGFQNLLQSFSSYLMVQTSQTSFLMDAPEAGWRRMVGRAIIWTGLGSIPWFWSLPFGWCRRTDWPEWQRRLRFLSVWFFPGFLFHTFVHTGSPGHVLSTIPVLCLAGGHCLWATGNSLGKSLAFQRMIPRLAVGFSLLGNAVLFLVKFPLPPQQMETRFRGLASVADAFRVGTYETSYAKVRWEEEMTTLSFQEIDKLKSSTDKPLRFIWTRNGAPIWRKVSYYFPSEKIYVLEEKGDPGSPTTIARLWSGKYRLARYSGAPPFRLPLPKGVRLIWLISPDSVDEIARIVPLEPAGPLYYTDLASDSPSFRVGSFELVPE